MSKTVPYKTIQFSMSKQFSSIWPIDRTLSGAISPDQSGPGSDGNEWVLCIPQISSITGTSPSYCLVSYPGGGSYPLQRCSWCILHPQVTRPAFPKGISLKVNIIAQLENWCLNLVIMMLQFCTLTTMP